MRTGQHVSLHRSVTAARKDPEGAEQRPIRAFAGVTDNQRKPVDIAEGDGLLWVRPEVRRVLIGAGPRPSTMRQHYCLQ